MGRSCVWCVVKVVNANSVGALNRFMPLEQVKPTCYRQELSVVAELIRPFQERHFDPVGDAIEPMIKISCEPLGILRRISVVRISHGVLVGVVPEQNNLRPVLVTRFPLANSNV